MGIHVPEKILVGRIKFGTTYVSGFYNDITSPYDGAPLSYTATFEIPSYSAGYPGYYNNPNLYNVNDVQVGWQFLLPNGKWYDITSIVSTNGDNEIVLQITDTDLRVLTTDPNNDPPSNGPTEGNYGILFPLINGIPQIANLSNFTSAFPVDSYWIDDLQGVAASYLAANGGGSGSAGTAGTSGSSGTSGVDGVSGTSGTSGSSGISGVDGTDGSSGTSGVDGVSGTSGTSGTSGSDGTSGDSLFALTGSVWATTNDVEITGSLSIT